MIYTSKIENRKILVKKKIVQFYQDITGQIRLQTDHEFQQYNIKKLNNEYNVNMNSTKLRGEKPFAAKQKHS